MSPRVPYKLLVLFAPYYLVHRRKVSSQFFVDITCSVVNHVSDKIEYFLKIINIK